MKNHRDSACEFGRNFPHHCIQRILRFETNARTIRQVQTTIFNFCIIGKTRDHAEYAGVSLTTSETEATDDVQRHLIAAVREYRSRRPAAFLQHRQRARELRDAVRLRHIDLDDVEVGFKGQESDTLQGLLAPAGTSKAIVSKLHAQVAKMITAPDFKERVEGLGFDIIGSSPADFAAQVKLEVEKWTKVVQAAGIKVN